MSESVQNQPYLQLKPQRRVIGPVPPRDAQGKFKIKPILAKRVKVNVLGEPIRDGKGNPLEEEHDTRPALDYRLWEPGIDQQMLPDATSGLSLWKVEYDPEPSMLVYARGEEDAIRVYRREMGITRCQDADPKATPVVK